MHKIDSYICDKCNSIYALEEDKKSDVSKLEKLFKILELFGFTEMAIK